MNTNPLSRKGALFAATETAGRDSGLGIVKVLLAAGADPNAVDAKSGNTPLHVAVNYGNIEVVKALLNANADVNIKNKNGLTPIFYTLYEYDLSWPSKPTTESYQAHRNRFPSYGSVNNDDEVKKNLT